MGLAQVQQMEEEEISRPQQPQASHAKTTAVDDIRGLVGTLTDVSGAGGAGGGGRAAQMTKKQSHQQLMAVCPHHSACEKVEILRASIMWREPAIATQAGPICKSGEWQAYHCICQAPVLHVIFPEPL